MACCPSNALSSVLLAEENTRQSTRICVPVAKRDVNAGYDFISSMRRMSPRIPFRQCGNLFDCTSQTSSIDSAQLNVSNDGIQNRDHASLIASSGDELHTYERLWCAKHDVPDQTCQTETFESEDLLSIRSIALGFNTSSSKTSVIRWTPGSTLYYYVAHRGLSTTQATVVQGGMRSAADQWQATGLGITFEETSKWQEATFLVAFNPALGTGHYALAFFPGWPRRVIDIGTRMFGELQYVTEVFGHELGHVLGLRHEFWEDNREPGGAYQYPSRAHDRDSIMNDRNVGNLSRFIISQADKDAIRQFYDLRPGQHPDIFIQDLVPRPAVEYLGLVPVQIVQTGGSAPAIRRQSVP